ncbi:MAG: M1 family metallopeptidase [Acidobacteria bacterium]|nr:M1 family metallopeptidase [Acidobacteriota bacterium]
MNIPSLSSLKPLSFALIFMFLFQSSTSTASAENTPQPIASYKIDIQLKLDEKRKPSIIEGYEQLTWLNDSPDTINDLQFHLYLNAFKNEKSTFFKESGGQLRGDKFKTGEWGSIDISEMKIAGGENLTSKIEYFHPDDDNKNDQTVIRVPLTKPLLPGQKITLEIRFTAKLPRVFARTGYWGQFALVAQWFPKIGVWESAGERRRTVAGWNCHQFHSTSEFYADYGNYDVTMTVPAIYKGKIGATGKMQLEQANPDETITYNFTQENVHDFAWTVDANYLVVNRTFVADQQVKKTDLDRMLRILDLPEDQIRLKDVSVRLLIQPEHWQQIDRHFTAAFNAIKYYGLWYGKYPYDTLTIVDPPYNGGGAGGMEYPTFITAGTTWWPGQDQNPEEVIVHEFGHQFWYGLVANNEFEESWLDEGFTTYSTGKVLHNAYGANPLPFRFGGIPLFNLPVSIPHPYEDRILTLQGKFNDPILTPTWKYYNVLSWGLNSYPRSGLVLNTLERYLGDDLMARVMREYHQKWRYRHPASQDFFDTVNQVAGKDLSWFFDQFVKGIETLDYEIAEAGSNKIKDNQYETDISIRRNGEAWFPVELVFSFKDGSKIIGKPVSVSNTAIEYNFESNKEGRQWAERWQKSDRWKKFRFTTAAELALAQVDPEEKVLLDSNLTNNSRKPKAIGMGATLRWGSAAMFWLQTFMQALSALG